MEMYFCLQEAGKLEVDVSNLETTLASVGDLVQDASAQIFINASFDPTAVP